MGKKTEKKNKGATTSRRKGRKPRLAKSWKPRKAGAAAPIAGLQQWGKQGKHATAREKELLDIVYNNLKVLRNMRRRGADAADEFELLTSIRYKSLWNWKNPPKKKEKKQECGPDGLAEAAEEDAELGGFSDDDLFGDAPLTLAVGGRSMGKPFRRGPKYRDPRSQLAQSPVAICDRF